MRSMRLAAMAASGLIGLSSMTAHAATYSAVSDYNGTTNPSGAWSYLAANTVGGTLTPLGLQSNLAGTGLSFFGNGNGIPTSVIVARNTTAGTLTYETITQPTTLLEVDPESLVADVQWKAPATGSYSVSGLFQDIDSGGTQHTVEILRNNNASTPLLNSSLSGFGNQVPFGFTGTFTSGETLDFLVAYSGNFSNLSTGLSATISTTPEPTSLALLGIGAVALVRRRRSL